MNSTHKICVVGICIVLCTPCLFSGVRVQLEAQGDGSGVIFLDHPFLNSNPDALLIVGPRDFNHTTGVTVAYDAPAWRISANGPPIPPDAHFWVMAFDSESGFRHTTNAGNTSAHLTTLDHPRLNNNPNACPIVTREISSTGVPVPFPFGIWYDALSGHWKIFYQDVTNTMPLDASFSVFTPDEDEQISTHVATADNIIGNSTIFDSAGIDQSQPHRLFVTQRYLTTYNDAWVATAWLFSFLIGNVDGSAMPVNAAFNVYIAPIFEDGFDMGTTELWSSSAP
jgi:hypothetical protein